MRACYFGPPDRRLFGVFDEPATGGASEVGVVLCYPYGPDYSTAFRSFRVLATRLARAGFHVLRFDYLGTGDSQGDDDDASITQWIADVNAAVLELRGSLGLREVSLIGLRLGATLAALAAARFQQADRLVLWEPVIVGREYVSTQLALHRAWVDEEMRDGRQAQSADDELLGYRLTEGLRHDLENVNLGSLAKVPAPYVYVVNQNTSHESECLAKLLREKGGQVELARVEGPTIWSRTPSMDEALVSNGAIQAIVTWLAGTSR